MKKHKIYLTLITVITVISLCISGVILWLGTHSSERLLQKMVEQEYHTTEEQTAIIGGADGPTTVFIAGKLNPDTFNYVHVITIILCYITVSSYVIIIRKKNKLNQ